MESVLRTAEDGYNVFPVDPDTTPQQMVAGPGTGNAESPQGWLAGGQYSRDINGNNAHAYLDTVEDNAPDAPGTPVTNGNFSAVADLTTQPDTGANPDVAVQNLFYLNNVIHDTLYAAGFDEAAGNFQQNNFGNGGRASDPVAAEAQDGGGTDNANFATPRDGQDLRMQMYLWNAPVTHKVVLGTAEYDATGAWGKPLDGEDDRLPRGRQRRHRDHLGRLRDPDRQHVRRQARDRRPRHLQLHGQGQERPGRRRRGHHRRQQRRHRTVHDGRRRHHRHHPRRHGRQGRRHHAQGRQGPVGDDQAGSRRSR